MYSFYPRRAQKRKKDSQVVTLFTLLESACAKALSKYVGEIDPLIQHPTFRKKYYLNMIESSLI
jgi:hypothetical protein